MIRQTLFVLMLLGLSSCAFKTQRPPPPTLPPPPAQSAPEAKAEAAEMKEAVAKSSEHIQQTHMPTPSPGVKAPPPPPKLPAPPPAHLEAGVKRVRTGGPVPADKSLGWLKNGNTRFLKGSLRADGASKADRIRLAAGEKPHAVVIACSDSRVPPEVIFDQKLGEIFVIRTAGDDVDPNIIRSIDYAVAELGTNNVVILASEGCRAFKGELSTLASTDGIAQDLLERSAILRDAVGSGEVKINRAIYHLEAGSVEWN